MGVGSGSGDHAGDERGDELGAGRSGWHGVGHHERRSGALGSTAGFAIMGTLLALTMSATLPDKLEPFIADGSERTEVVDQVVDDANPRAVVAFIGPGQPLADEVNRGAGAGRSHRRRVRRRASVWRWPPGSCSPSW